MAQGASVALVSDAGTPLISDPGFKLVREASSAGFAVIAVPGAIVGADGAVGRGAADRPVLLRGIFAVEGAGAARAAHGTRQDRCHAGLFESGNRVQETLADLAAIMGTRDAAICRELTKVHEEIRRAPVNELAKAADAMETRGEFVLVIGPPASDAQAMGQDQLDDLLRSRLAQDSVKDAVAHAVELSGRPRREVYARALELAKELRGEDGED